MLSKPDLEVQQTAARLGAASAVLGALLGLIVNLMHGDLPGDPEAALTRVAATTSWGLLHLGIMASVVLILGGLWGLSQVPDGPHARRPDLSVEIQEEIVHEDKVVHRLLMGGTHLGEFQLGIGPGRVMGTMPPTGRTFAADQ